MIKTLRITSIIAVILAGIFFIFPVVFGVRGDEQVEQLLSSPGAIEKFNNAKADKTTRGEGQSSPLVKQAQAFALYLNPPQPKIDLSAQRGVIPTPRGPVTPQFTLIGTSFCPANPELSLAFIDELGKGLRLVRQSSQLGHLVIEQIKDGLIVVREGQRTFELAVQVGQRPGESGLGTSKQFGSEHKSSALESSLSASSPILGPRPAASTVSTASTGIKGAAADKPELDAEQSAALEKLVEKLRSLQKGLKSDKTDFGKFSRADPGASPEEKAAQMEKFISDFKAARVSTEEAEKLGDLGKELEGVQEKSSEAKDK